MEYMLIVLAILALMIILFYQPVCEKMTNKALLETLDKFGKTGTKPKPVDPNEQPIYGPKMPKLEEPTPASSSSKDDGLNVYPDIYGPEVTPVPGQKKACKKGEQSSDCVEGDTHEYNPDFKNAFPMDENEPQPFLTDFSKFQH
jgi:hypothetical protein